MNIAKDGSNLHDWELLQRYLPPGWQAAAGSLGALRRARGFSSAAVLLRCLLVHLAAGCSLKETSTRARQLGWARVSPVALFKRLRSAEQWLRWMAEQLWRQSRPAAASDRRVRVVDATVVHEPGPTGSLWRIHYCLNLSNLQCDFLELTTPEEGECLQRLPIEKGDLILGDRAYGKPPGIGHVSSHGGDVLVRINLTMLPLQGTNRRPVNILAKLRTLRVGRPCGWAVRVQTPAGVVSGRLVAVKRSAVASTRARVRLQQRHNRKQTTPSAASVESAGYVFVFTTLDAKTFSDQAVLELYRLRWQIELTFKRLKSLLRLGQLPKRTDASSRAWLHGKLLVALLTERLIEEAILFSPWGYHLASATQPMA